MDRRDVGMVHRGQDVSFTLETGEPLAITGHFRRQHLQRDLALEFRISRAIDLTHASRAKGRDNLVVTDSAASRESDVGTDF
jgi:hypothetical protein